MISSIDFGITGRTAFVCGSSAGLGRACAEALLAAGAHVVLNGRDADRLAQVAAQLGIQFAGRVAFLAGDVSTAEGRDLILREYPALDILVNNSDGPPTGNFEDFDEAVWAQALDRSMIAPIMMMRAVIKPMMAARWGRIINITSSTVRAPLPMLGLSNGARNGLTGFVAGLAREVAEQGVTINNLLPGRFETERLQSWIDALATDGGVTPAEMTATLVQSNPMKRFGKPAELGAFCAFLASEQASYITGQNILIDGGEFPGI
ncbi:SDR family oxidoreductase [Sphingobium sp. BS19]|uniref:SDR family oxidoreductase n=1 Tax=Sphingobium sp. BS19 TaxID=3018973 RepID=UPI0022ED5AE3|nr:SDR family oxidoreductase [Sphingobium sp. BS19]GLJ00713.1 oxidoreductase [Sphingobium sp. BS19]